MFLGSETRITEGVRDKCFVNYLFQAMKYHKIELHIYKILLLSAHIIPLMPDMIQKPVDLQDLGTMQDWG